MTGNYAAAPASGARPFRLSAEILQISVVVADILVLFAAGLAAGFLHVLLVGSGDSVTDGLGLALFAAAAFVGLFALSQGYRVEGLVELRRQMVLVGRSFVAVFFLIGWAAFLLKVTSGFSRGVATGFFVIGLLGLTGLHAALAVALRRRLAEGRLSFRRVYVAAVCDEAGRQAITERLSRGGTEVVGFTVIAPRQLERSVYGQVCLQASDAVRRAMAVDKIDAVHLHMPWRDRRPIDEFRAAISPLPVPIRLFADEPTERILARPAVRYGGMSGFEIQRAPLSRTDRAAKRLLDIAVAGSALVLLSPLLLMVTLGLRATQGPQVLFLQDRKGFGGRPFKIIKFRTMTVAENGAEIRQAEQGDARVTRLGAILRKTSIDELPQLLNVLKGEMSIVGPRPHALAHDNLYDRIIAPYAFRHHVKPGITGWAQVNGCRGATRELRQMEARVEHDLWYINNWSIRLDLLIIARTAIQILNDRQAV